MKWQKYHTHQAGDTDCGPASVRTVLRRHGVLVDTAILRESIGLGDRGSNLLRLRDVLGGYGIEGELLRLDVVQLAEAVKLAGPAIVLLEEDGYRHFVVVHETNGRGDFLLSDPMFYRPRSVTAQEFSRIFHGETLITDRPETRLTFRARLGQLRSQHLLWEAVREHRGRLALILLATVVVALVALATSLFVQIAVDRVVGDNSPSALTVLSSGFITIALAAAALQYARGRLIVTLGQRLQRHLSQRFVRKLLRLPTTFFQSRRTGDLVSRLDDVQEIQSLVAATSVHAAVDLFVVVSVGSYLLFTSPFLFLFLIPPTAINILSSYLLYPPIKETSEEALQRDATLKSETLVILHGHSEVTSYGKREFAYGRVNGLLERRIQSETRLGRLENVNEVIKLATQSVFTVGIAWVSLVQMTSGDLSIGQVFGFLTMAGYFLNAMESMASLQVTVQRTAAALGRYRDVALQRDDPRLALQHGQVETPLDPVDVSVRSLSFAYSGSGGETLNDLSLDLPADSSAHLQGRNGSGKSTLLKVLAGMCPGYRGSVSLGGAEVCNISEDAIRERILYVPETPVLLAASLRENLTLGVTHTESDVLAACRIACFDEILARLPNGLDEHVREDGTGFSRGQIQRLSLARALLHAPRVYLFDESFSGIDRETFARVWERFGSVKGTKVVVSHGSLGTVDFDTRITLDPAAV